MRIPQPDIITIVKSDGTNIPDVPAFVQRETIFISDGTVPLEESDIIERTLPSGLCERYQVIDRGFYSYPNPHYQVKITKESAISKKPEYTTVIHQHGDNSRVNIKSTDSSTNTSIKTDLIKFEEIKQVLNDQISDDKERETCIKSLDELKNSVGSSSYGEKFKNFVDITSKYVTIVAPFIPYLVSYL